jgi:hypothetical protein
MYYKLQYLSGAAITYTSPVRTLLGSQ